MENITGLLKTGDYTPDILWENFRITPELLMRTDIIESSIYLTRRCNLKCQYCKIIKTELSRELTIDEWIEVIDILDSLGVRFVNIAGGEPTIVDGIGRLIRHLNTTAIEYSIVSNSVFNDRRLKEIVDAGLKAYVASIDVIEGDGDGVGHLRKSSAGMQMLERLKAMGVPYLCANIVISGRNIENVMDVVRYLVEQGIWVNVCPIIWGKGDNWAEIEKNDEAYRLKEEHRERLKDISSELLFIKRHGGLILPTESYLTGIPCYGVDLNWKCFSCEDKTPPPRIIVDADGALMTCINMRGKVSEGFTIFALKDKERYKTFIEEWWRDARSCSGCYWSTMVMAKERQEMLKRLKEGLGDGTQG